MKTPAQIARIIDIPLDQWPGRCHEIAGLLLRHEIVTDEDAELRYGHWLGPVSSNCVVTSWIGAPFARHGWIEIPADTMFAPCKHCDHMQDEHGSGFIAECKHCDCPDYEAETQPKIIDPTRWVFEAMRPYIYEGRSDYYDMGGNALRASMEQPCPAYDPSAPRSSLAVWKFDPVAHRFVMGELFDGAPGVTQKMARWLGNLALPRLKRHAHAIYTALVDAGETAAIPIDNYRAVLGDSTQDAKTNSPKG